MYANITIILSTCTSQMKRHYSINSYAIVTHQIIGIDSDNGPNTDERKMKLPKIVLFYNFLITLPELIQKKKYVYIRFKFRTFFLILGCLEHRKYTVLIDLKDSLEIFQPWM